MTLVKILLNSIISTEGAKCVMFDVKDFYLNTPMTRYEYMRLKLTDIPEEIIVEYKLREISTSDGYVYVGNHTRKFQLLVMGLTVPVLVPVPVLSAARTGTVHSSFFDRHPFLRSYPFPLHTLIIH